MRFLAAVLAMAALAGCAQYDAERQANLAAAEQERTAADDASCQHDGLKPGTPAYDQCRTNYANLHAQQSHRQLDLANEMLNAHQIQPIGQ